MSDGLQDPANEDKNQGQERYCCPGIQMGIGSEYMALKLFDTSYKYQEVYNATSAEFNE